MNRCRWVPAVEIEKGVRRGAGCRILAENGSAGALIRRIGDAIVGGPFHHLVEILSPTTHPDADIFQTRSKSWGDPGEGWIESNSHFGKVQNLGRQKTHQAILPAEPGNVSNLALQIGNGCRVRQSPIIQATGNEK